MTTWRTVELPFGATAEVPDESLALEIPDGVVTLHRNKAAARTIEYWKTKEVFCALRDIFADEIQECENALWEIIASNDIDRAFGASLDKIGRLLEEPREGRMDPAYRVRLKARTVILRSQGRTTDIIKMLRLLDDAAELTIIDTPPAAFTVLMAEEPEGFATLSELPELISQCRAAGIGASLVVPGGGTFWLGDSVADTVEGSDLGDSVDGTVPLPFMPDLRLA